MTSLLVLGDSGLLGQALLESGRRRGIAVRGASRRSADLPFDALRPDSVAPLLDRIEPDVVINCVGLVDVNGCERQPELAWHLNASLPATLAFECAERRIRSVHISTDHFFSGDRDRPHDEKSPVRLVNQYARSKYAGEQVALTCPNALAVRTNIIGFRNWPGQPTFVEWLVESLENQSGICLYEDFFTSSISVAQFSDVLFRVLETSFNGLINIASSQGASKLEFAQALASELGLSTASCRAGSVRNIDGAKRAESLVLDVGLAEELLKTSLPGLNSVIRQLASEYSNRNH